MENKLSVVVILSVIGIGGLAAILLLAGSLASREDNSISATPTVIYPTTTSTGVYTTPLTTISNALLQDGTYSSTIEYITRGHEESITVSITLDSGVVTELKTEHSGNDDRSQIYQSKFASSIDSYVVGKELDKVSVSRVSGASDTTRAFMEAIAKIEQEAAD